MLAINLLSPFSGPPGLFAEADSRSAGVNLQPMRVRAVAEGLILFIGKGGCNALENRNTWFHRSDIPAGRLQHDLGLIG
ncbi:hypothetical protein [uncultured Pseudomonas sp.]|uniref:hypothetical protein n=1 Tax=uncultured Pseudomonas sp. TaxID=114707 RepID=UPI0025D56DDF|nr:hypothetical protein [uncultured Pseudomonas sp.]